MTLENEKQEIVTNIEKLANIDLSRSAQCCTNQYNKNSTINNNNN